MVRKAWQDFFYLDNSPTRVEFLDGTISRIVRLDDVPAGKANVFIAPGFSQIKENRV